MLDQPAESAQDEVQDSSNDEQKSTKLKPPFLGFGVLCAVFVAFLYAVQALTVKLITSMEAIQISASRCGAQWLIVLPYSTYVHRKTIPTIVGPEGSFLLLVAASTTGAVAAIFSHQALLRLSAGDAETILFLNIVFTMVFGWLCLGDALTLVDALLCVLTLAGVVLLAKPPFLTGETVMDAEAMVGVFFSIARALTLSTCYVLLRKMSNVSPTLNVQYYSFVGSVLGVVITAALDSFRYPCLMDLLWIFVMGGAGCLGQAMIVIGLKYERAGTFAVARSFQIVFVFVLQVIILHDIPDVFSIIGSSLVFTAVFIIGLRKVYNQKKKERKES